MTRSLSLQVLGFNSKICLPTFTVGKRSLCANHCLLGIQGWLLKTGLLVGLTMNCSIFAQVLISPVVIELSTQQRVVAVTVALSDKARVPMRLQAELLQWKQNLQGKEVTEPSDDLLISPQMAELQPGSKQVFRLTLRGVRPAPEELAYRLIFEDIAEPIIDADSALGMIINFRTRYDLPVLIAPTGPVVNALRWKLCPPTALAESLHKANVARSAEICIRVLNTGNRRIKVESLMLSGKGWSQSLSFNDGENVLAGTEREWTTPLVTGLNGAPLDVQVRTTRGVIHQAELGDF